MKTEYGLDMLFEARKIAKNLDEHTYLTYTDIAKRCKINTTELNKWSRQWFNMTGSRLVNAIRQKKLLTNNFPIVAGFKLVDVNHLPKIELEKNHELSNNVMVIEHRGGKFEYIAAVYRRNIFRSHVRFTSKEIDESGRELSGVYSVKLMRQSGMAELVAIHAFLGQLCQSH